MQSSGSQTDRDHKSTGDDEDFDEYVDQQVGASSTEDHAVSISPLY